MRRRIGTDGTFNSGLIRHQPSYLKLFFDGSRKENGKTCAGIVILWATPPELNFQPLANVSVPLKVDSACQAELGAMIIAFSVG